MDTISVWKYANYIEPFEYLCKILSQFGKTIGKHEKKNAYHNAYLKMIVHGSDEAYITALCINES